MKKLCAATLVGVALVASPAAHADGQISPKEQQYIAANGKAICQVIDAYPSADGVLDLGMDIMNEDGFSPGDTADIINASVMAYCPQYWSMLMVIGQTSRRLG